VTDGQELIIIVDDDITNLAIARKNLTDNYAVLTAPSGKKLFDLLEKVNPELILLDVNMPEMSGYDVIKRLKSNEDTAQIPVIFLTAKSGGSDELEGLSLGAVDYIVKPFSPVLLNKRIALHLQLVAQKKELMMLNSELKVMVDVKTRSILDLQNTLLHTIAELVEYRDDITGGHIDRMQDYLEVLIGAIRLKGLYCDEISQWDIDLVLQSAQLHDVGKIAIPDNILLKPGKLTPEEFELIKTHTVLGEGFLSQVRKNTADHEFLDYARTFIIAHHEKWDGSGYPYGLKGENIPLLGRIMAIVDVYDALVSDRPYKKAFPHEDAVNIIRESSGTHFEPALVDVFLYCHNEFERVRADED
jgi:putative two-component system response regulator